MPRRKKNKSINLEGLRRKCVDTRRVGQVAHIHIEVPPSTKNYNPKEEKKVIDSKDAIVTYYSSTEAAEAVHGENSFTNHYTEEDFWKA